MSDRLLCWKESILASYPFLDLLHEIILLISRMWLWDQEKARETVEDAENTAIPQSEIKITEITQENMIIWPMMQDHGDVALVSVRLN